MTLRQDCPSLIVTVREVGLKLAPLSVLMNTVAVIGLATSVRTVNTKVVIVPLRGITTLFDSAPWAPCPLFLNPKSYLGSSCPRQEIWAIFLGLEHPALPEVLGAPFLPEALGSCCSLRPLGSDWPCIPVRPGRSLRSLRPRYALRSSGCRNIYFWRGTLNNELCEVTLSFL